MSDIETTNHDYNDDDDACLTRDERQDSIQSSLRESFGEFEASEEKGRDGGEYDERVESFRKQLSATLKNLRAATDKKEALRRQKNENRINLEHWFREKKIESEERQREHETSWARGVRAANSSIWRGSCIEKSITICGCGGSQKSLAVEPNETLADIRSRIYAEWSLREILDFVHGNKNKRYDKEMTSGFSFHYADGTEILDEYGTPAIFFNGMLSSEGSFSEIESKYDRYQRLQIKPTSSSIELGSILPLGVICAAMKSGLLRPFELPIFVSESWQEHVTVKQTDTLEDVRTRIANQWAQEELQRLLFPESSEESISFNYSFHYADGRKIKDELWKPAYLFDGNNKKRKGQYRDYKYAKLFIKAEHPSEDDSTQTKIQPKKYLLFVFCTAVLGWTPPVWLSIQKAKLNLSRPTWRDYNAKEIAIAVILFLIFIVDFLDAVVDLCVSVQVKVLESDTHKPKGTGDYGSLLFAMTIVARMLSGWYGVMHNEISASKFYNSNFDKDIKNVLVATFFLTELSVFMIEDGAAILYLASRSNNENGYNEDGSCKNDDFLRQINTVLTSICGICFVCYNIYSIPTLWDLMRSSKEFPTFTTTVTAILGMSTFTFAVAMVTLLIQEVWSTDCDSDNSFSNNEELTKQWNIIYGVGVASCFLLSSSVFLSFEFIGGEKFEEIKREQRTSDVIVMLPDVKKAMDGLGELDETWDEGEEDNSV